MITLLLSEGTHGWWGGGIVFFILALIVVLLLAKFVFFRGWWGGPARFASWPDTTPEAVLKRRLAGGEISEADYDRLLSLLRK